MRKQIRSMNEDRSSLAGNAADLIKGLLPPLLLVLWAAPSYADPAPAAPSYPAMASLEQYLPVSQADEIALARSAGPKPIADNAAVLTLGKSGYETAVKGSNGFVCYVGRSWEKDFDDPEFWNPKVRTPQCWNAAAVSSVLPEYLKRTQWVLAGVSKDEMVARTKTAWASHEFVPPALQSVVFLMSKDQYISDPTPGVEARWYPHLMFLVPATEDSKWGANVRGAPIFSVTSDVVPLTYFFVILPKWSDGSVYPYPAPSQPKTDPHG
jgi:hypothetical protein